VTQIVIGLIDTQPWVKSALEGLLGPEFEVLAARGAIGSEPAFSKADIFLVGNTSDDPRPAMELVGRLSEMRPRPSVFLLAWTSSERIAIAALKSGVADYFPAPVELREVAAAVQHRAAAGRLSGAAKLQPGGRPIIGGSPAMESVRGYLLRVAQRDCNALVLGETGTGKDLIAEAIHANSRRRHKPFVSINCAAIPDTLLESELFGHERGAFTGAHAAAEGKIWQAHNGTIFFDEIGEMTPYAQAKMLTVIEGKQIQRLGGKANLPVDIRIIAATNQDLPKLVAEQRFRRDLYFRLNVAQIKLPALRDRRDDIAPLLEYYVKVFNDQTGARVEGFTGEALERLTQYEWPGNVRELKNVVESIFVDPPRARIDVCHLVCSGAGVTNSDGTSERELLLEALQATQWNKSRAAGKLHWSRMKVYRKMAKYEIADREEMEPAVLCDVPPVHGQA